MGQTLQRWNLKNKFYGKIPKNPPPYPIHAKVDETMG